jgi:hypothetical protein
MLKKSFSLLKKVTSIYVNHLLNVFNFTWFISLNLMGIMQSSKTAQTGPQALSFSKAKDLSQEVA